MKHQCFGHLQEHWHSWREPHGEPCGQIWWVCAVCGEKYTTEEAAQLIVGFNKE